MIKNGKRSFLADFLHRRTKTRKNKKFISRVIWDQKQCKDKLVYGKI